MGPAIRHATYKLNMTDAKVKILFLLSDGRPQDHGYGRDRTEKEYAIHDTKQALNEAKREGITPFALTVDRAGHDYLKTDVRGHGLRGRGGHRVAAQPPAHVVSQADGIARCRSVSRARI